jgi:homoserine O-acetyltransferase
MTRAFSVTLLVAGLGAAACAPRRAPDRPGPVPTVLHGAADGDQRIAELGTCTLDSGEKIEDCRLGYRTFGKLDAARSNIVLFPTWFTGRTRSLVEDVPNKMVDAGKYHVVLVDALGNGTSSGPSTSRTQPRLRFPRFTIHDMVEAERRLVREVLGAKKVHAVMGISMGGMQAYEWAVSHPDEVGRFVSIVGTPQLTAQDLLLWSTELHLLQGSTAFAGGAYDVQPKIPALQELHWLLLTTPAHRNAETSRQAFPAWAAEKASDTTFDWNDWHRQLEAMLVHDVARAHGGDLAAAARTVKAKGLVIVANHDLMVNPEPSRTFARAMNATLVSLDSPCGHLVPGCDPSIASRVRRFVEE